MNDRVDAYFERLRGKRAVVLGIGVSNRPLIRMLLEYGAEVTACDKTPREKLDEEVLALERLGARLHVGEDYLEGLEADVVFRTHDDVLRLIEHIQNEVYRVSGIELEPEVKIIRE